MFAKIIIIYNTHEIYLTNCRKFLTNCGIFKTNNSQKLHNRGKIPIFGHFFDRNDHIT